MGGKKGVFLPPNIIFFYKFFILSLLVRRVCFFKNVYYSAKQMVYICSKKPILKKSTNDKTMQGYFTSFVTQIKSINQKEFIIKSG